MKQERIWKCPKGHTQTQPANVVQVWCPICAADRTAKTNLMAVQGASR